MKILTFIMILAISLASSFAQDIQIKHTIDSLRHQLTTAKADTSRVLLMVALANRYREPNPDSTLILGYEAIKLARKLHFPEGEIRALAITGRAEIDLGNLPKSLEMQFEALKIAERNHLPAEAATPLNIIGGVYFNLGNYPKALNYYKQSKAILEKSRKDIAIIKLNIGNVFEKMNQLDSAFFYTNQVYQGLLKQQNSLQPLIFRNFGNIQAKLGNNRIALNYYKKSLQFDTFGSRGRIKVVVLNLIAKLFQKENQPDSSIYYAQKALAEANLASLKQGVLDAGTILAEVYETKNAKKSLQYYKIAIAAKDSLFGATQTQALQTILIEEQERQREVERQRIEYENRLKQYLLIAGLVVFIVIVFILYRNNQREKKAKNLLQEQKNKVEITLFQLKSTQTQLIQKEKLASLGEFTAGIAHEIQNPLNFVNNFSELSVDLAKELKEEIEKVEMPDADKKYISEIISDLSNNQEKINLHGKRASGIVKGMLEHSRASLGKKELTDINALAEEYLKLSYHGMKAKNKNFEADFKTDFDAGLPKIEVVPQDIGRVLMNLFNNAFYAVNVSQTSSPCVQISTRKLIDSIEISVQDDGIGMSEAIKAKIFQPFFTTKPTGEGTGLGLSLAYDIVTKGHGGTIEVESKENEGSTFIIKIPV